MNTKQKSEIIESIYDRLLYTLLTCSIATRPSLLVLSKNQQSIYRAIRSAIQAKHIKEYSTSIKVSNRRKKITYYGITRTGINYLSRICHELPRDMSWVQAIPWQEKSVSIFGEDRTGARIYRYLRMSTANIFFSSMGAEVWPLFIESSDSDKKTGIEESSYIEISTKNADNANVNYISILKSAGESTAVDDDGNAKQPAKSQGIQLGVILKELFQIFKESEQNHNGSIKNHDALIKFAHSKKMSQLLYTGKDMRSEKGIIWGRETGIVESPLKTVLIYTGDKRGMSWSKFHTDIERREYRKFNAVSTYHNINVESNLAMLIVDNPKMFADLFFNTKGRRREEQFGGSFTSMIVVPDNREGIANAYHYLMTDTRAFNEQIVEDAIQSGVFMKRTGRYDSIFPLQDLKGTNIAIGVYLDGIQIRKIRDAADILNQPFGVICYAWQREYYERVLPETKFIIMED